MSDAPAVPTVALPSGAAMPMVGLGTWKASGREAYRAVRHALEVGYRHVDTATIYGNEDQVGKALRDSGITREDVFVTTKLWTDAVDHPEAALRASLKALDVDQVDLYLIHWPPGGEAAPQVWQELRRLRDAGLARDIGVSNYSPSQLDELVAASGERPAVNQIRWAPPLFDAGVLAGHRERGVVLEGYSPLRRADLASPVLRGIAETHGVTPAQVVLRWHLDTGVVVIPKSANPGRIEENLAVTGFALSEDEVARIDATATSTASGDA